MSNELISKAEDKMKKAVSVAIDDFNTIRTGKANAKMLDKIEASYYGAMTPIAQIAGISVPEPSQIVVKPYDVSSLKDIEKAIIASDLNLNPSNDGQIIRLSVPPLNQERRKELAKQLHGKSEEHKVAIRNIRRDSNEHLKKEQKDNIITEDEQKKDQEKIQKLTDKYIAELEKAANTKEKEITEM